MKNQIANIHRQLKIDSKTYISAKLQFFPKNTLLAAKYFFSKIFQIHIYRKKIRYKDYKVDKQNTHSTLIALSISRFPPTGPAKRSTLKPTCLSILLTTPLAQ